MMICGTFSCVLGLTFTVYTAVSKPDVSWKKSELPPFERVKPTDRRKLYVVNQVYKPIDELERLKADIGHCKE